MILCDIVKTVQRYIIYYINIDNIIRYNNKESVTD